MPEGQRGSRPLPGEQQSGLTRRTGKRRVGTDPGYPDQALTAPQQRQAEPFPGGDGSLLEKFLQGSRGSLRIGLQTLATLPGSQPQRRAGEQLTVDADTGSRGEGDAISPPRQLRFATPGDGAHGNVWTLVQDMQFSPVGMDFTIG